MDAPAGSQERLVDPVEGHGGSSVVCVRSGPNSAGAACLLPRTIRWPPSGRNISEEAREVDVERAEELEVEEYSVGVVGRVRFGACNQPTST